MQTAPKHSKQLPPKEHRKHVFPKKEIGYAPALCPNSTVLYMHLSIIHVEPERECVSC